MIPLLTDRGMAALAGFISRETLFAFDLDGTLAPIVADPASIRLDDRVREGMIRLSKLAQTAVITGRSRGDASQRLGFSPTWLVGNHGAEGLPGQDDDSRLLQQTVSGWEQQLESMADDRLENVALLERKGLSLSLHYRHAPNPDTCHAAILDMAGRLLPAPRLVGGKFVVNLIPQGLPDKGAALLQLMELSGCKNSFFIGDDETDEDVFRLQNRNIFTVSVGTDRDSRAAYRIDNQGDVMILLEILQGILSLQTGQRG